VNSSSPRISVVIPCRNGEGTIGQQLDALEQQSMNVPWELIVSDNGSSDQTTDVVRNHSISSTVPSRIVDASRSPGIQVARNEGIRAALGHLILLCDSDDVVDAGWMAAYASLLDECFAIGGGPLDLTLLNSVRSQKWGHFGAEQPVVDGWLRYAFGANMAITKPLWVALGGFDERYAGGWDEVEMFARAYSLGASSSWSENAVVNYRLRESQRSMVKQRYKYGSGEYRARMDRSLGLKPPPSLKGASWVAFRRTVDLVTSRPGSDGWYGCLASAAYRWGVARGALRSAFPRPDMK
jgi:glycosyltransferase involved in cell wall biosynthesis